MGFEKLSVYLDSLLGDGIPGCDLAVYRDHEMIYRHMAGCSDAAGKKPLTGNETYCLYSCSKVFTTCAVMQLVEKGKISLDAPVADYLPEYAHLQVEDEKGVHPAKRIMTIRHLMSMQGGLDYDIDTPALKKLLAETDGKATTRQIAAALAQKPLHFEPGEDFLYSLCHDVLAAVVEVASGKKFSDYLRENIWAPLGLSAISFDFNEDNLSRLCDKFTYDADKRIATPVPKTDLPYRLSENHESGGAGLISDLKDYALFADALACEGVGHTGKRILFLSTIQLWSASQLSPNSRKTFDTWRRRGYSYALGVRTRVNPNLGGRGQMGEFGWDGAAGAWVMIDPVHHLSAFYVQHVLGCGYAYDEVHPTIRNLIYEALEL